MARKEEDGAFSSTVAELIATHQNDSRLLRALLTTATQLSEKETTALLQQPVQFAPLLAAALQQHQGASQKGEEEEDSSAAGTDLQPDHPIFAAEAIQTLSAAVDDWQQCVRRNEDHVVQLQELHRWAALIKKALGGALPA